MDREFVNRLAAAIGAPDAVITREHDHEPINTWRARAVLVVLERAGCSDTPTPLPAFAAIAALMFMLGLVLGRWVL